MYKATTKHCTKLPLYSSVPASFHGLLSRGDMRENIFAAVVPAPVQPYDSVHIYASTFLKSLES